MAFSASTALQFSRVARKVVQFCDVGDETGRNFVVSTRTPDDHKEVHVVSLLREASVTVVIHSDKGADVDFVGCVLVSQRGERALAERVDAASARRIDDRLAERSARILEAERTQIGCGGSHGFWRAGMRGGARWIQRFTGGFR
jgi:hypothetical protein